MAMRFHLITSKREAQDYKNIHVPVHFPFLIILSAASVSPISHRALTMSYQE